MRKCAERRKAKQKKNEKCDEMKRMNEGKKKSGMGGCKGRFAAVASRRMCVSCGRKGKEEEGDKGSK